MADNNSTANKQLKTIFNPEVISDLGQRINRVFPSFNQISFEQYASHNLDLLELKQRSKRICTAIAMYLPSDFETAVAILIEAMGEDDGTGGIEGYNGFRFMPFLDFVAEQGLNKPDIALDSLEEMTLYFSAEFAIRPFILTYPDRTLPRLMKWASNSEWRLRRLASEGSRPRLPWGKQLKPFIEDPSPVLNILNQLYTDSNLVVRRSVANNLNDIAKDHPDLAVETARYWLISGNNFAQWTVRHGLRTLLKQGHKDALELLGFVGGDSIRVKDFKFKPLMPKIGEELNFSFSLISYESTNTRLVVDYVLHRVLANGQPSKKIFKLRQIALAPGETIILESKHKFKQLSTRTYYPGTHSIEIIANGRSLEKYNFKLIEA